MNTETIRLNDMALIPHLDQWADVWMIEPGRMSILMQAIRSLDVKLHLQQTQAAVRNANETASQMIQRVGDTAVISLEGTLQKHAGSMSAATSTVLAARAIRMAAQDESITSILLAIDSPGGTSAGTAELAKEINKAKATKPVYAHITDLGASAAYWIASQATKVTANEAALVGSIGTYAVVSDVSAMAAKEGVKVHVVRAGAMKGAGVPGTEVTQEQLSEIQQVVDSRNELFLQAVAAGRKMSMEKVRTLADGRVYEAKKAVEIGLIDAVADLDEALAEVANVKKLYSRKGIKMSEGIAATTAQIRDVCPGCSDSFVLSCVDKQMPMESVARAYVQEMVLANGIQQEQLQKLTAERDEAVKALAAANAQIEALKKMPGVDPASSATSEEPSVTAKQAWDAAITAAAKEHGVDRIKAAAIVSKRNPELRQAVISEANQR